MSKKENWSKYVDEKMHAEKKKTEKQNWARWEQARETVLTSAKASCKSGMPLELCISFLVGNVRHDYNPPDGMPIEPVLYMVESWVREGYEREAKND